MAREMKDSGVAWIGAVPASWNINSLSQLFVQVKNKNSNLQETNLLSLSYGKIKRRNIESSTGLLPESFDGYNIIEKDDIVLRLTDLQNDQTSLRVGLAEERGIITSAYLAIRKQAKISAQYLFYYLCSFDISKGFYGMGGGVRQGLNWDGVKWLKVLVPPFDEQERIAIYLSQKCAEIDAVLEKTRASVEEYKKLKQAIITQAVTKGIRRDRPMTESGVTWIGVVPLEWTVSTLGKFITIDSGISVGKKYESGTPLVEVPYLRVANVQGDHVDLSDVATIMVTLEEAEKYKLKAGQLLMTEGGDRDKLGRGCLWNGEIENCIHQNHVFAVQTDNRLTVKYLDYLTTSEVARVYFDLTAKKTTNLACTSKSTIQKFVIPVPPVAEQNAICDYLDRECTKLDNILHSKSIIIEQLEAYKKSLIYEYVTGKKETSQPKSESTITFVDARALLLCRIIELLKPKGRIHLMKTLFTVDCLLNLNSETQYQRQKHGPYDVQIEEYERITEQKKWISIKKGRSVDYILAQDFETFRNLYEIHYGNVDKEIQRICAFLRPMKTSHAERVATLLAVWNDFIIDGITPTDSQIVQEVRSNWTPNKAHSSESTWLGTLSEMKAHQIMPFGYGKHTEHMQDSEV